MMEWLVRLYMVIKKGLAFLWFIPRRFTSIPEMILNESNEGVMALTASGEVIYANKKAVALCSFSNETLIGRSVDQAFCCFEAKELLILKQALISTQLNHLIELNAKDATGRARLYVVEVTRLVKKHHAHMISLSIKDISHYAISRHEHDFLKNYDITTGVLNRNAFVEKLQRSMGRVKRYKTNCAVIFLGLDGFMAVNQAYGHQRGDFILKEITKRIQSVVRDTDVVARFGGDEFLVLLDTITDTVNVAKIIEYIIHAIQQPFEAELEIDFMNISAGIAVYPQDEQDPTALIQCAKTALLEAKKKEKGSYQYYDDSFQKIAQRKIILANELRKALRNNQLEVYFQPLLQAKTLRLLGVEALARWHHPHLGYIPPQEFIQVAEEMGFIAMLGRYIFSVSCAYYAKWTQADQIDQSYQGKRNMPSFKLAINLSVKEFLKEDFVDFILQTVKNYDISPSSLQLEITESVFIHDTDFIMNKLFLLKAEGFEIVMDDFGTGYSCLSILSALPIDVIKIDRSFTQKLCAPNPAHQAVVRAIVALAKNLNLKIIAEGVGNIVQQSFMTQLGVDGMQGYLFSQAMPPQEMQLYIENLGKQQKDASAQ